MGNGRVCPMCRGTAEVYDTPCPQCGDKPWHGRIGGYTNHGCRCPACQVAARRWRRSYQRRWRARRREQGLTVRGTEPKRRTK